MASLRRAQGTLSVRLFVKPAVKLAETPATSRPFETLRERSVSEVNNKPVAEPAEAPATSRPFDTLRERSLSEVNNKPVAEPAEAPANKPLKTLFRQVKRFEKLCGVIAFAKFFVLHQLQMKWYCCFNSFDHIFT